MAVVAEFSANKTTGLKDFLVQFTDLSTGAPDTWLWEFGAGEGTSSSQNPSHVYTTVGTFTVKLTATLGGDSDEEEKVAYITVKTNIITKPSGLFSGISEVFPKDGWENEKNFFLEQADPFPCSVQYFDLFIDTTNE